VPCPALCNPAQPCLSEFYSPPPPACPPIPRPPRLQSAQGVEYLRQQPHTIDVTEVVQEASNAVLGAAGHEAEVADRRPFGGLAGAPCCWPAGAAWSWGCRARTAVPPRWAAACLPACLPVPRLQHCNTNSSWHNTDAPIDAACATASPFIPAAAGAGQRGRVHRLRRWARSCWGWGHATACAMRAACRAWFVTRRGQLQRARPGGHFTATELQFVRWEGMVLISLTRQLRRCLAPRETHGCSSRCMEVPAEHPLYSYCGSPALSAGCSFALPEIDSLNPAGVCFI
jgi:hypothetical protein